MKVQSLLAAFVLASCGTTLLAQNENPDGNFAPVSTIQQASLTTPARVLQNRQQVADATPAEKRTQVRVDVRTLLVDEETRRAIYKSLDPSRIKTEFGGMMASGVTTTEHSDHTNGLRLQDTIQRPIHVSSCVLNNGQLVDIIRRVETAEASRITSAPRVIVFSGVAAKIDNLVQRPFMIDAKLASSQSLSAGDANAAQSRSGIEPVVRVFEQGTSIRLIATANQSQGVQLFTEVAMKEVKEIEQMEVFGITDSATTVQIPSQHTKTVATNEVLQVGQSLLIDPYTRQQQAITKKADVPLISKIPYVSATFKNTSSAVFDAYVMYLIEPVVHADDQ